VPPLVLDEVPPAPIAPEPPGVDALPALPALFVALPAVAFEPPPSLELPHAAASSEPSAQAASSETECARPAEIVSNIGRKRKQRLEPVHAIG
jgi:hypothetical protein